jgi:carboxyl-terminal processing protease
VLKPAAILAVFLVSTVAAPASADPVRLERSMIDSRPNPATIGVWRSRGYGFVADIAPGGITIYNEAGDLCWPDPDASAGFPVAMPHVRVGSDQIGYAPSAGETAIVLDRLPALPSACRTPIAVGPVAVFDAFWATMRDQYAFFDLHGVDWEARREAGRAAAAATDGDRALFEVLARSLEGLDDPHLTLSGRADGEPIRRVFNRPRTFAYLREVLDARPAARLRAQTPAAFYQAWVEADGRDVWGALGAGRRRAFDGRMMWGMLDGDVGYIGLTTLNGFGASGALDDDLAALGAELDRAIAGLRGARGLIVDVTQNLGGSDAAARLIASRFADQSRVVYAKSVHNAPELGLERVRVAPAGPYRYLKPTVILTSDVTLSAAEVLVLSMRAFPHVVQMGETTRGGFSDVLDKTLPNGWRLSLSNEVYMTPEGRIVEGAGLEPAVTLDVFPADHVERSRLAAVRRAAAWLIDREATSQARPRP